MYDQQGSYGAPYQSNPRSGTYGYQSNAAPPSSGYGGQGYPAPNPEAGHTTGAGGPPPYGGYAAGGYAGDAGFGYGHQDAPYGRGTVLDAPTPRGGGWVGRRPSSSGSGEGHNGYKANYGRDAPRFGAVRLRGLPFGVRENEIAIFLVGFFWLVSHFVVGYRSLLFLFGVTTWLITSANSGWALELYFSHPTEGGGWGGWGGGCEQLKR
jgi:hypothetical protein